MPQTGFVPGSLANRCNLLWKTFRSVCHSETCATTKNRLTIGFFYANLRATPWARTQGLVMHLGELEKQVLQFLWGTDQADAKQVFAHFKKRRGGSLNTIQSTLDRLFKKGLLLREKQGHAFKYMAAVERQVFIGQLIKAVTSDFSASDENPLLAAFTSISSEFDEEQLGELERLIEARRAVTHVEGNS
jgi:predicted transcriptional regulator